MAELTRIDNTPFTIGGSPLRRTPVEPAPAPRACSICNAEIAPFLTITGRWVERSCVCEREARRKKQEDIEHKAYMRSMAEYTYGGWLGKDWINPKFVKEHGMKSFDQYDTERLDEQAPLLKAFEAETDPEKKARFQNALTVFNQGRKTWRKALVKAKAFAENPQGVFLIYGDYGLGKSHLLASICNYQRHRETPMTSLFVVTPRFFSVFYDRMNHSHDEWELVRLATSKALLVFDDLDKSGPKEFRQEIFCQIIDERITARLPIAISTNKRDGLDEYIGKAAYSRLMDGCIPVEVVGKDYRLNFIAR